MSEARDLGEMTIVEKAAYWREQVDELRALTAAKDAEIARLKSYADACEKSEEEWRSNAVDNFERAEAAEQREAALRALVEKVYRAREQMLSSSEGWTAGGRALDTLGYEAAALLTDLALDDEADEHAPTPEEARAAEQAILREQVRHLQAYIQRLVDDADRTASGIMLSAYGQAQLAEARALLATPDAREK